MARGLQRNKKTSVVIVLEGGKPKWWARGMAGCYRGEWREGRGLVENAGDGDASYLPCSAKGKK